MHSSFLNDDIKRRYKNFIRMLLLDAWFGDVFCKPAIKVKYKLCKSAKFFVTSNIVRLLYAYIIYIHNIANIAIFMLNYLKVEILSVLFEFSNSRSIKFHKRHKLEVHILFFIITYIAFSPKQDLLK